jgi:hypothetical protein
MKITIRIFKFVWEILPLQPTIQPQYTTPVTKFVSKYLRYA